MCDSLRSMPSAHEDCASFHIYRLGTEGESDDHPLGTTAVDQHFARRLHSTMMLAQAVDERLRRGIASGEFVTAIWPPRGQEAIAAGRGAALRRDDRLVTTYRGLHDLVGKGVLLTELIGEVLGRRMDASRGKGATMHISCPQLATIEVADDR